MQTLLTEKSLFYQLRKKCGNKANQTNNYLPYPDSVFKNCLEIVASQNQILLDLLEKSRKSDLNLLKNISFHSEGIEFSKKLGLSSSTKNRTLVDAMQKEINIIREILQNYQKLLSNQKKELENKDRNKFLNLIKNEWNLLTSLDKIISQESDLQKSLKDAIEKIDKFEHSDFYLKLTRGILKLMVNNQFDVLIENRENIPKQGPVIIAARHFDGDNDPAVIYNLIDRPFYPIAATDYWSNHEVKFFSWLFNKLGAFQVHRQDAIHNLHRKDSGLKDLELLKLCKERLELNQAILIFPEAWPIIDSHYTPRDTEKELKENQISDLREGIFILAKLFYRKNKIHVPIIPVGIYYYNIERQKHVIARVGEAMFIENDDVSSFLKKIKNKIKELSKKI